jgi:CRP-like cAMP-binding protein
MQTSQARQNLIDQIVKIPYFRDCSEERLLTLVSLGYRRRVEPGEFICFEGDVGNSFSIILSGEVEVILVKKRQILGRLQTGDFFGEIAVLTGTKRTASVRTTCNTQLFVIHRDHLRALLIAHPILAEQIATTLSERELTLIKLGVLEKLDNQSAILLVRSRLKTVFDI